MVLSAVAWQVAVHVVMTKPASPVRYRVAYVDPGTGLLALQILGSSIVGSFYLLRSKLRSLLDGAKLYTAKGDSKL